MSNFIDLTGHRYGWLEVICKVESRTTPSGQRKSQWLCLCTYNECNTSVEVSGPNLRSGNTQSCGCLVKIGTTTHGMSRTRTYKSWTSMMSRCHRLSHPDYPNYGGRGIKVCDHWLKFENFLEDMGVRPEGKSLDRYPNNNGDYEPKNCRWATPKEQINNQRKRT